MSKQLVKPLRFLHIPKSGGQTFNYVLSRQYNRARTFAFSGDPEGDLERYRASSERHGQFDLFRGHAPICTDIEEANKAATITFLREPLSRVKSFCQHVSEGKSSHLLERFPVDGFDLSAFLNSGVEELANLQTKMLINTSGCHDANLIDEIGEDAAVALALKNLKEQIAMFGLLEHYDESLIHFADQLGWSLPVYARKNTQSATKRLSFGPQHLEKIRELNQADEKLYAQAKQFFESSYVMTPEKQACLRRQQFFNRYWLPAKESIRMRVRAFVRLAKGNKS